MEKTGIGITHDNRIEILGKEGNVINPVGIWVSSTYERGKGSKVINYGPLNEAQLAGATLVLAQYDRIFAIDTNTKDFSFAKVSLASIVLCRMIKVAANSAMVQFAPVHCFEFWNCKKNPEKVAWRHLIKGIIANSQYDKNWKIGIVVDSDLGNLSKYNAREIPVIDDFFLPPSFTLNYASADVGKEYLPNQLLSLCDKEANSLLTQINEERSLVGLVRTPNDPDSEYFRRWDRVE